MMNMKTATERYATTAEAKENGKCIGASCGTCMYAFPGNYMVSEDWTNISSRCLNCKKENEKW